MEDKTLPGQSLFATAHIQSIWPSGQAVGTGFIYNTPLEEKECESLLVSNRHVFKDAEHLIVRMVQAKTPGGGPKLGYWSTAALTDVTDQWFGHPDPEIDVAVLPFELLFSKMNVSPYHTFISSDNGLTKAHESEFQALEKLIFTGYPIGIFDTANKTPIIRTGTTATPIEMDYQGKPQFLIDAAVYGGSSGSPVFSYDEGIRGKKDGGGLVIGKRPSIFLGLIRAVHEHQRNVKVGGFDAMIPEPVDLGVVIKARALDDCVDAYLEQAGRPKRKTPRV